MLRMDYANESDIPALKAVWRSVFKDTSSYIDNYFNYLFSDIKIAVCRAQNGKPVSMLSMLPVELKLGEQHYPGHYIYAAATEKKREGQGIMTALLQFACQTAKERGDTFSCLIPATEELFAFYSKRGYRTVFYRDILHFPPYEEISEELPVEIETLSFPQFRQLRTAFAEKQEAVILQDARLYPYIYAELEESRMKALLIRSGDIQGYAVCYRIDDLLAVKETSLTEKELKAVLPKLERYFSCRGTVAAFPPRSDQDAKPYGMLRPLADLPDITATRGYMGLLMD